MEVKGIVFKSFPLGREISQRLKGYFDQIFLKAKEKTGKYRYEKENFEDGIFKGEKENFIFLPSILVSGKMAFLCHILRPKN